MNYPTTIITISDKASSGKRIDRGGPTIKSLLDELAPNFFVNQTIIIPDELVLIQQAYTQAVEDKQALIITTGGTGCSLRDVTPEATTSFCERLIPGIAELMRLEGLKYTPMAMLSRAVCGIKNQTVIINFPGNPNAIKETLPVVMPLLQHALSTLYQPNADCADTGKIVQLH